VASARELNQQEPASRVIHLVRRELKVGGAGGETQNPASSALIPKVLTYTSGFQIGAGDFG
jgi:hypothetical protein